MLSLLAAAVVRAGWYRAGAIVLGHEAEGVAGTADRIPVGCRIARAEAAVVGQQQVDGPQRKAR